MYNSIWQVAVVLERQSLNVLKTHFNAKKSKLILDLLKSKRPQLLKTKIISVVFCHDELARSNEFYYVCHKIIKLLKSAPKRTIDFFWCPRGAFCMRFVSCNQIHRFTTLHDHHYCRSRFRFRNFFLTQVAVKSRVQLMLTGRH